MAVAHFGRECTVQKYAWVEFGAAMYTVQICKALKFQRVNVKIQEAMYKLDRGYVGGRNIVQGREPRNNVKAIFTTLI